MFVFWHLCPLEKIYKATIWWLWMSKKWTRITKNDTSLFVIGRWGNTFWDLCVSHRSPGPTKHHIFRWVYHKFRTGVGLVFLIQTTCYIVSEFKQIVLIQLLVLDCRLCVNLGNCCAFSFWTYLWVYLLIILALCSSWSSCYMFKLNLGKWCVVSFWSSCLFLR